MSPDVIDWGERNITSMVFLSQVCNQNLIVKKHQTPTEEYFTKQLMYTLKKFQGQEKNNNWLTLPDQNKLKR